MYNIELFHTDGNAIPDCLEFESFDDLNFYCKLLSDYIINQYEVKMIYKIIFKNMEFFTKLEKKKIFANTIEAIKIDSAFYVVRQETIKNKLMDYLLTEDKIIMDGFVTFRLNQYFEQLEEYVLKEVDKYLTKKDYDEFLDLIKYFVGISMPKYESIDVYYNNGNYEIYDDNKVSIVTCDATNMFDEFFLDDNYLDSKYITKANSIINDFSSDSIMDTSVTTDDILLSSLISIAPNNITIHDIDMFKNKELIETIYKVFGSRVR